MIHKKPDIDIDFADRDAALKLFTHVPAARITEGEPILKHATGVYFNDIPVDLVHGCASIDHLAAEKRGYFKLDFLNMSVYCEVKDEEHLLRLVDKKPSWLRLQNDREFTQKVVHIGEYYHLLREKAPDSIARMAMFLAFIRPGKAHLQSEPWEVISKTIWDKGTDGYSFKKSHAVSYAMLVAVHMNLIEEQENDQIMGNTNPT